MRQLRDLFRFKQGRVHSRLVIITIAFGNVRVIEKQITQFYKHGAHEPGVRLVVADNSMNYRAARKIKQACKRSRVHYYKVPRNPYSGIDPSRSHGYALNWAAAKVATRYSSDWVGFLDHDMFLITGIQNLLQKLNGPHLAYGVINRRVDKWYFWPGFCFFNISQLSLSELDFMPVSGLDTGGGSWIGLYSKLDEKDYLEAKLLTTYKYGAGLKNKQRDAVQIIDGAWLHLVNASNWAGVDMTQKVEKLDTLIDVLTIDVLTNKGENMKNKVTPIKKIKYESIVKAPYCEGAIVRDDFPGFKEDYLAIHSILRKYQPRRLMEIGTSSGSGTNIICNAMGVRRGLIGRYLDKNKVISIDVPPGTDASIIYPEGEDGHPQKAGANCKFPYTQLFGSSIKFDFKPYYPLEAWFIDGKHDYEYCSKDTKQSLKANPDLIIWHDMQIKDVYDAVAETMAGKGYKVEWVEKTRVAFAIKE